MFVEMEICVTNQSWIAKFPKQNPDGESLIVDTDTRELFIYTTTQTERAIAGEEVFGRILRALVTAGDYALTGGEPFPTMVEKLAVYAERHLQAWVNDANMLWERLYESRRKPPIPQNSYATKSAHADSEYSTGSVVSCSVNIGSAYVDVFMTDADILYRGEPAGGVGLYASKGRALVIQRSKASAETLATITHEVAHAYDDMYYGQNDVENNVPKVAWAFSVFGEDILATAKLIHKLLLN